MPKNIDEKIKELEKQNMELKQLVNECKFEIKKMYLELNNKKQLINSVK